MDIIENDYFVHHLDSILFYPENKILIIKGWAFSKTNKKAVKFKKTSEFQNLTKELRKDVNSAYGINGDESVGFIIKFDGYTYGKKIVFDIGDDDGNEKNIVINIKRYLFCKSIKNFYTNIKKSFPGAFQQLLYSLKTKEIDDYSYWIYKYENNIHRKIIEETNNLNYKPKISIVIPVYNVSEEWLNKCIDSVIRQYYTNWELCIADDNSTLPHVKKMLDVYKSKDKRIKVIYRKENGHISEATNTAIDMASGEYIAFMDNDDEISPIALLENVKKINEYPEVDFIYSDEDKIDIWGKRFDPFFKPDWNPRLILNHNYITHFVVVKKELLKKVGMLKSEMNGAQDYDFVLRATEQAERICHISKILYHWRTIEGSTASNPQAKEYAYIAGKKAVENALKRRGYNDFFVNIGPYYGINTLEFKELGNPLCSIIFKKTTSLKKQMQVINRIVIETDYPFFEVICDMNIKKYANKNMLNDKRIQWVNFSDNETMFLNKCAEYAHGSKLVFMDERFIPDSSQWLQEYLSESVVPEVGIIGPKLISEKKIWSAGIHLGKNKEIVYTQRGININSLGYYFRLILPQNVFAVSFPGLFIDKNLFFEVNGFEFKGEWSALDICLKVRKMKRHIIFNPRTRFSANSIIGDLDDAKETKSAFLNKWSDQVPKDPYTNINLKTFGIK